MMYDKSNFTYGLELEYADVLVGSDLPAGCCWNDRDYSIVNSSGIANDPKCKLWPFGGEINTRPTDSVEEQIEVVENVNVMLHPKPVVNYKCNMHVHIGVPGLDQDLQGCKKLLQYITDHQKVLRVVDPLPRPVVSMFHTHEEYEGALARRRRNLVSHRKMLPDARLGMIMQANTIDEFMDEHASLSKDGKRLWFISPRPGINIRQLQETKTIEFRHFFQTLDMREVKSSLIWCREFMHLALTSGEDPLTIFDNHSLKFPTKYGGAHVMLYDHYLYTLFKHTNLHSNNRKTVRSRLDDMVKILFVCTGNINRSPAAHTILKSMLMGSTSVAVDSAGVSDYNEGKKTSKRMRDVLAERGYSYYPITSKKITQEMVDVYDLIIYMSDVNLVRLQREFGSNERFVPMVRYSSHDISGIPDPQSGSVEEYRDVVGLLEDCCINLVDEVT
jgi:protein-tyrosine phosphatase